MELNLGSDVMHDYVNVFLLKLIGLFFTYVCTRYVHHFVAYNQH